MTAPVRLTLALLMGLVAVAASVAPGGATVVTATLYPDSALVTSTETLSLTKEGGLLVGTFTLPQTADPDSLRLSSLSSAAVTLADVQIRPVNRRDEGRIKDLQARLDKARAVLQGMADDLASREAAAAFWRAQAQAGTDKSAEAKAMANAVREGLGSELKAASAIRPGLKKQTQVVKELQQELERLTGSTQQVFEVSACFRGQGPSKLTAVATYRLRSAGWRPAYTLNALPTKGLIEFTWDALVWQHSGTRWDNAKLTLATAEPAGGSTPPALRPWVIRPQPKPKPVLRSNAKAMKLEAAPAAMDMVGGAQYAAAPVVKGAVFDSFDAGRTTLESGDQRRLTLTQENWKATFDYLVRPVMGERAFVRAAIALDKAPRMPAGEATYLMESALIQKRGFELHEKEADLFFGSDPQLGVEFLSTQSKSGQSGFLTSRKTHAWNWVITITNARTTLARVLVEDSLPNLADERIELTRNLGDAKTSEDHVASWELEIPAGQDKRIEYGYEISWPKDMELNLGGR